MFIIMNTSRIAFIPLLWFWIHADLAVLEAWSHIHLHYCRVPLSPCPANGLEFQVVPPQELPDFDLNGHGCDFYASGHFYVATIYGDVYCDSWTSLRVDWTPDRYQSYHLDQSKPSFPLWESGKSNPGARLLNDLLEFHWMDYGREGAP